MFIPVKHLKLCITGWRKSKKKKKKTKERMRERDRQTDRWTDERERMSMNHYSYMVNK